MRYLYIVLIILITALIIVFMVQNVGSVTVSFLTVSLTMPLSLLVLGIYFLGMLTGGMVISTMRQLIHGAKKPVE